ncbi:pyridoxamine 5'-phosphate oxidase family protein [Dactylosporangium sp. NPDC049525]|uniref:pyridoxamine 5'-phosphate oxidase family protein n=1 Tax=Dactylosporangium sp. NPDC049525 TaxID=3154730 RepID=UPI003441488C
MFPPEAVALLSKRVTGVITTLLPDGSPHSVVAGVMLDGDQIVSHTGPAAKRLANLRANPRINVIAIDPDSPMRYVEVRGTATLQEGGGQALGQRFKEHAEKYGLPEEAGTIRAGITVVQIRVTPTKVSYHEFDPSRMGPATTQRPGSKPPAAGETPEQDIVPSGTLLEDEEGRWIEFERRLAHAPEAVWAALTEPRRLAIWQHPVEYLPDLRLGATIFAQLNPQARAFALGKVTVLEPPRAFAFRWTTNNPLLPPEFTIGYTFEDGVLKVRSGPFGPEHGIHQLAASMQIHLDHLEKAVTTPEDLLPTPPWPPVSVVTRSGLMRPTFMAYASKFPEFAVQGTERGARP